MLRSQRGGRADLRAEGRGGSGKGRGLDAIEAQEMGGCQVREQHRVFIPPRKQELDPDPTALEEEPADP